MAKDNTFSEVFEKYINQNKFWHLEGSRGLKSLCKICEAIGYEDDMMPYFADEKLGRVSVGALTAFLEDNPGAIQTLVEWIGESNEDYWRDQIEGEVLEDEDDEEEFEDE